MRDPNRIGEIVEILRGAWERHPDWRLGQLISNAVVGIPNGTNDPFYVEDDVMADRLWELFSDVQHPVAS